MKNAKKNTMKKAIRNFVIGAAMAIGVFASTVSAFAASQFVQTDMNFRSGASTSSSIIGSVPAGAQVEVLDLKDGWNLIRYNGKTGYIHGGNLADSYVVKKAAPAQNTSSTKNSTQQYFDSNWTGTAQSMNDNAVGTWKTVSVSDGYLALRNGTTYDAVNEIGKLNNGDTVQIQQGANGSYVWVYSPKYDAFGWVNAGFLR